MLWYVKIIISACLGLLVFSSTSQAVPQNLSFQSKIYKPDGTPLDAASVSFRFTTVDPTGTCILFVEDFAGANMSASAGLIILNLGTGTKVFPTSAYTYKNVFNNLNPTFSCQGGGTYTPGASGADNRKIIAQFNDGTVAGWQTLPAIDVNSVPFANYAGDSVTLAGFPAGDFLRNATLPLCATGEVLTASDPGSGRTLSCVPVAASTDATAISKGVVQIGSGLNVAAGVISLGNFDAAKITTGIISPARIGSGAPGAGNFLRGDGVWTAISAGGVSSVSSTNSYLTIATPATTPAFTVNVGTTRNRLASVDLTTGNVTGWNPNIDNLVNAVAISGANVYAGGIFTSVNGGTTRNYLAALDLTTGNVTAWDPNMNGTVNAVAINGANVYAGGSFTAVNGGTIRNRLAALDLTTSTATAWDPNMNNSVSAVAISGTSVYAGGFFTTVNGGTTRNRLAALDLTTGTATAWDPNMNNFVTAVAISGSSVYAGGYFTTANGGTTRNYLAALDLTTGTATAWDPNVNNYVNAVAVSGVNVYAGGNFTMVNGGTTRNRLAALDLTSGFATAWDPNMNGPVNTLVINGTNVYAGGSFTTVNG